MRVLAAEVRQMRDEVSGLRHKDIVSSGSDEMNSTYLDNDDRSPTDEVPVVDIFLVEGELSCELVQVLKVDGRNTNVVSFEYVQDHRQLFIIMKDCFTVRPWRKKSVEEALYIILEGTLYYRKSYLHIEFDVACCRYN